MTRSNEKRTTFSSQQDEKDVFKKKDIGAIHTCNSLNWGIANVHKRRRTRGIYIYIYPEILRASLQRTTIILHSKGS